MLGCYAVATVVEVVVAGGCSCCYPTFCLNCCSVRFAAVAGVADGTNAVDSWGGMLVVEEVVGKVAGTVVDMVVGTVEAVAVETEACMDAVAEALVHGTVLVVWV